MRSSLFLAYFWLSGLFEPWQLYFHRRTQRMPKVFSEKTEEILIAILLLIGIFLIAFHWQ